MTCNNLICTISLSVSLHKFRNSTSHHIWRNKGNHHGRKADILWTLSVREGGGGVRGRTHNITFGVHMPTRPPVPLICIIISTLPHLLVFILPVHLYYLNYYIFVKCSIENNNTKDKQCDTMKCLYAKNIYFHNSSTKPFLPSPLLSVKFFLHLSKAMLQVSVTRISGAYSSLVLVSVEVEHSAAP